MVASLNGIIFDQIYGDNSGGAEFDTDGDGSTTQEDEFISFTNNSGVSVDISGWEVWSDSSGVGAPDGPQDGLYHVFPPGTVLAPGGTMFVITEITGPTPGWAQEASEGGAESGAGGVNTNFLSEGDSGLDNSIALVDPVSGDFLVFNLYSSPSAFSEFDGGSTGSNSSLSGFPGDNMVAEIDGASVESDMNAGSSYQYHAGTDSYVYAPLAMTCFAKATLIDTPNGPIPVERLRVGDLVDTRESGPRPVRLILSRHVETRTAKEHPVVFAPGSLGHGAPVQPLTLSPQHRVLVGLPDGREVLCPAKALLHLPGVRSKKGGRKVAYFHLVLDSHEILFANGAATESFFFGKFCEPRLLMRTRLALATAGLQAGTMSPARPFIGASAFVRAMPRATWPPG